MTLHVSRSLFSLSLSLSLSHALHACFCLIFPSCTLSRSLSRFINIFFSLLRCPYLSLSSPSLSLSLSLSVSIHLSIFCFLFTSLCHIRSPCPLLFCSPSVSPPLPLSAVHSFSVRCASDRAGGAVVVAESLNRTL